MSSPENISIIGARLHNLKNIDLKIPRGKITVFTGLSGSGKSTLAFDTLYAEGQRRYVESLSAYVRQFLDKMQKPDLDSIDGLSPAIAIEQKVATYNPRSTVGTSTEIYDYVKLLFARAGETYSPKSGSKVTVDDVTGIANYITTQKLGSKIFLCFSLKKIDQLSTKQIKNIISSLGYSRIIAVNKPMTIEELNASKISKKDQLQVVVDRFTVKKVMDMERISDSIETALMEGHGECLVKLSTNMVVTSKIFSTRFEADNIEFEEPSIHLFSFNNAYGACPTCEGFGQALAIDTNLVIPDRSKSVYDGAISCWNGKK